MARKAAKTEHQTGATGTQEAMTQEEAMQIIESVARGQGDKSQKDAAEAWLRINGAGEIYTKYTLEVVLTDDRPKKVIDIPTLNHG